MAAVLGEDRLDLPLEVGGRLGGGDHPGGEPKENQARRSDAKAIDGH
jgi:hypothetical protein